ncbi:DNA-protecting protein DprA [Lactococcus piscium]|uniref:DNA protecting protein DprA n=1 Tax=Pseudolactococcus paracarnosus TaxID=2749962 RepID=A0A7L4WBZ8_9LACT|nr:DNA-processing protein DprA [Lactococcus paracarnosus]MCJ1993597.1 DNA-protecting protein DprA [Lactococcus paracarnosus]QDJ27737.1 DNA protecting protein DprA [Lactococcus paracarnosus]SPC36030.1 Rossmann fold nucleotide-binding protein Smf possibly involved in DNA uptake [Lactococcus piscium]
MTNFDLYRLKKAGMSNLVLNQFLAFISSVRSDSRQHDMMTQLPKFIRQATMKHKGLFWERFKQLDTKALRQEFLKFSSFSILDKFYPEYLREIHNPPVLLFYQGDIGLLAMEKIAFVGSRSCSKQGIASIQKIIKELNNQFVVISGLARGIDTACHLATIKNGGRTISVIGTGLDVSYPRENEQLQSFIAKNHLIITEYGPGEQPLKYHFPERNRIIAGLSRGVVVTEAKRRSGSLITCERAMESGRDVFAIPGTISDGLSDGCHHLIQEGAKLVYQGQDILSEYPD